MAVRRRFPIVLILCGVFVALLLTASVNATPDHSPLYQSTPSTPSTISYQGRVLVNGARFNGVGLFKFAVINSAGDTAYWSNDGTGLGAAPFQPTGHITLTVSNGVFGVALGDTSIAGMTQPITAGIATSPDRSLRVWFNDGTLGWQQLAPDVALASVPYALVADSAASATTATTATFAYNASVAISATTATTATSSYNANLLGGLAASSSPTGAAIVSTNVSGTVAVPSVLISDSLNFSNTFIVNTNPMSFTGPFVLNGITPTMFIYYDAQFGALRIGSQLSGPSSIVFEVPYTNGFGYGDAVALSNQYVIPSASFDNQLDLGLANPTRRWKSVHVGTGDSSFEGKVGVGTSSPSELMHLYKNVTTTNAVLQIESVGAKPILRAKSSSHTLEIYSHESGAFGAIAASGQLRMTANEILMFNTTTANPDILIYGRDSGSGSNKWLALLVDSAGTSKVYAQSGEALWLGSNNGFSIASDANQDVSIGTTSPISTFKLTVAGSVGPTISGTYSLGSSTLPWNEVHYKTLVSHSLGSFESGVKLSDGRIVSCLDALSYLRPDQSKTLSNGQPHLDYATLPIAAFRPAVDATVTRAFTSTKPVHGSTAVTDAETGLVSEYIYTITEQAMGEPGADLDAMVSLVLCAANEVNAKSATLEARIAALEKALGVKP